MDQTEQESIEYQRKKRELEKLIDDLNAVRRKGEQLTEVTFGDLQWTLQRFSETREPLEIARQELAALEEDFFLQLEREKKKLTWQEEELEQDYRKKMQERQRQ